MASSDPEKGIRVADGDVEASPVSIATSNKPSSIDVTLVSNLTQFWWKDEAYMWTKGYVGKSFRSRDT